MGDPVQSLGRDDPLGKGALPTAVFFPGEFCGQRSLAGYSPWSLKESDPTEQLTLRCSHSSSSFRFSNYLISLAWVFVSVWAIPGCSVWRLFPGCGALAARRGALCCCEARALDSQASVVVPGLTVVACEP